MCQVIRSLQKRGNSHFCGLEESFPTKMAVCASPVADSSINTATEQDHLCFLYQTAEPVCASKDCDRSIGSSSETDIKISSDFEPSFGLTTIWQNLSSFQ